MKSRFHTHVTVISNEFIDEYMAGANGEYVKVYLYLQRHQNQEPAIGAIADALNHTEADVRRAIAYWKKTGVLVEEEAETGAQAQTQQLAAQTQQEQTQQAAAQTQQPTAQTQQAADILTIPKAAQAMRSAQESLERALALESEADKKILEPRPVYTPVQVNKLAHEEDFTQLLYIAQKYMNKVFTPKDCEVFAYLYDGLHMSVELLEYLVEYCVQGGYSNIRYMEKVALSWHEEGIRDVEEAKSRAVFYSKDTASVMKAFGLSRRNPAEAESKMIKKWFKEYGFTREIVTEACNRTMAAIHTPSFQYTDKILAEWKKAGVKRLGDITELDEKRESKNSVKQPVQPKTSKNQFHNFEQRDTNYDAMVLERLKARLEQ